MATNPQHQALLDLERRRAVAIAQADAKALRSVLTSDYTHVHANGRVDDIEVYIDLMSQVPRSFERGEIAVRDYGDAAILVGEQINTIDGQRSVVMVTQTAVRANDEWRFATTHVSRVAPPT